MPRIERLPPSAAKVFTLSLAVLAADGAYRWFFARLLPDTAAFNLLPQDLAVAAGALPCALLLYWMARLRYTPRTVRNLPGAWSAALLILVGLASAAACGLRHRVLADFDLANALPRAAGVATALAAAACEECGFRGSLFPSAQELGGRHGTALALALGSLGFGLLHSAYQSPWSLPFAAAAGLALGVARFRGASLGVLILAHTALDGMAALWLSPTLSLGYSPELEATGVALLCAAFLWFLPEAERRSAPAPA